METSWAVAAGSARCARVAAWLANSRYARLHGSAHAASSARTAAACVDSRGSGADAPLRSCSRVGGSATWSQLATARATSEVSAPPVRAAWRSRSWRTSRILHSSAAAASAPFDCGCPTSCASSAAFFATLLLPPAGETPSPRPLSDMTRRSPSPPPPLADHSPSRRSTSIVAAAAPIRWRTFFARARSLRRASSAVSRCRGERGEVR